MLLKARVPLGSMCGRLRFHDDAKPEWQRAVRRAEKIVGYPTSFANLRWLMSDEVANIALHLRKLMGSQHPILQIAKDLLYGNQNESQAWGLLILLVCKAAGPGTVRDGPHEADVFRDQRVFAEITEIIKNGHSLHKGLYNISEHEQDKSNERDMVFGNKIALLTGDYLLATANGLLSGMKNQYLSEMISSALRDLTEGEFVGDRSSQNLPMPCRPNRERAPVEPDDKIAYLTSTDRKFEPLDTAECIGTPLREWTARNVLGGGSLLGRGCEGALHLAGHDKRAQDGAFTFGCRVALAWQASREYEAMRSPSADRFSLVCAPVLFALEHEPSLYELVERFDYAALKSAVQNSPALERTELLYRQYSAAADAVLDTFPNCDATDALRKIIFSM